MIEKNSSHFEGEFGVRIDDSIPRVEKEGPSVSHQNPQQYALTPFFDFEQDATPIAVIRMDEIPASWDDFFPRDEGGTDRQGGGGVEEDDEGRKERFSVVGGGVRSE